MSFSRRVKATVSLIAMSLGLVGMSSTAHAQIPVTDGASIAQDAANFVQTVAHYAEQIQRYEQQIRQLESQYDSITGLKFNDILNPGTQGMVDRIRLRRAIEGTSDVFGLGVPDSYTENMVAYNRRQRFLRPEDLYPDDEALQQQMRDLQKTLYAVDATVGETSAARDKRLDVYEDLAEKARNARDLKASMEVTNALLLENGRNLAMLIELQTAQLGAESVTLREKAERSQGVTGLFGVRGQGPS